MSGILVFNFDCKNKPNLSVFKIFTLYLQQICNRNTYLKMITYPNSKINIGLKVVERRPDGYHNLETVFYPIKLQDALEIHDWEDAMEGENYQLKVSGAILDGSPDDNLVARAYRLLKRDFPELVKPLRIFLFKHVPTGAGLGGGSADAAFMLKAMNERFGLGLGIKELQNYATQLGADCAFFIEGKPVFAEGIGDVFSDVQVNLKGKTLILVKPDVFVSTKDAYSAVIPHRPKTSLKELLNAPIETWKDIVVNDFERSVFPMYPEIAAIKDRLYDLGAVYASMSGSGASVYGIFDAPVEYIDEIFSGYFCRQRLLEV